MLTLAFILTFLTITLLIFCMVQYYFTHQKVILRLNKYFKTEELQEKDTRKQKKAHFGMNAITKSFKKISFLDNYKEKVQKNLNMAHIMLKPEEFIIISIALGWFIPKLILNSIIQKRVKKLNEQLWDTILLISNSLKAGYSFFQAIDSVVVEMNGPIAEEFAQLQKEISLGNTTEKALENLAERVPSRDMDLVVTAVLIQR